MRSLSQTEALGTWKGKTRNTGRAEGWVAGCCRTPCAMFKQNLSECVELLGIAVLLVPSVSSWVKDVA